MTMNNQSPLIPQGSLVEQPNKGRARVKIAVFLVLTIHGIGLMALLMQGCKKEPDTTTTTPEPTNNPAPAFVEPTNAPPAPTNIVAAPTNTTPTPAPVEQPAPATTATDYVIVKGDIFSTIAEKVPRVRKGDTGRKPLRGTHQAEDWPDHPYPSRGLHNHCCQRQRQSCFSRRCRRHWSDL